jgi:hypothetical protein
MVYEASLLAAEDFFLYGEVSSFIEELPCFYFFNSLSTHLFCPFPFAVSKRSIADCPTYSVV